MYGVGTGYKTSDICSESSGQVYRQAGSQCMEWVPGTKPQILAQKVQDKYIDRLAVSVWSGYRVQNLRYFAQKVKDRYRQAGSQCMEWVPGTKPQDTLLRKFRTI